MKKILLLSVVVVLLSGCGMLNKGTILYPISDDDIYSIPQGAILVIPAGTKEYDEEGKVVFTHEVETTKNVKKQGWVLSDFYVNEVMETKVKK